jgi:hypothetical protein
MLDSIWRISSDFVPVVWKRQNHVLYRWSCSIYILAVCLYGEHFLCFVDFLRNTSSKFLCKRFQSLLWRNRLLWKAILILRVYNWNRHPAEVPLILQPHWVLWQAWKPEQRSQRRRPLLGNDTVNTFPQQRIHKQQFKNGRLLWTGTLICVTCYSLRHLICH